MESIQLQDCTLLPLSEGKQVVSREYAVFCRVPPAFVDAVEGRAGWPGEPVAGHAREA